MLNILIGFTGAIIILLCVAMNQNSWLSNPEPHSDLYFFFCGFHLVFSVYMYVRSVGTHFF